MAMRLAQWLRGLLGCPALAAYVLSLLLALPVFFPRLGDISPYDESVYVNSGRELVQGSLPVYANNPLVASLYALTYLPFRDALLWLPRSCGLGRFILFTLLWVAAYLVATQLRDFASPAVMAWVLLVSPAVVHLVCNGSDALFAAMAAFGLWQFLAYFRTRRLAHLGFCSLFVALAALSRNEGAVLFLTFCLLTAAVTWRAGRLVPALLACVTPFASIVGIYLLVYAGVTGHFQMGTAARSYYAFEQGHGVAFSHRYAAGRSACVEGQLEARTLFGMPQENGFSVARAMARNPGAFFARVPFLTGKAAARGLFMYGQWLGVVFFLLAVRGGVEIGRRCLPLLLCLLGWMAYAVLFLTLSFRDSQLLVTYSTFLALASVGTAAVLSNFRSARELWAWSVAFLTFAILGLVTPRTEWTSLVEPARVGRAAGAGLTFLSVWIAWGLRARLQGRAAVRLAALVLIATGLFLRTSYFKPQVLVSGPDPQKRAVLVMKKQLAPETHVASYSPASVWCAGMRPVLFLPSNDGDIRALTTPEDLRAWIEAMGVEATYVDADLALGEPALLALIKGEIGRTLSVAVPDEPDGLQVLMVTRGR